MQVKYILVLLASFALCGCNTVRQGVKVGESVLNAGLAVKDDVVGAVNTLINAAESVKTNALAGAKSTADAATK